MKSLNRWSLRLMAMLVLLILSPATMALEGSKSALASQIADAVILPGYARLEASARLQRDTLRTLCEAPGSDTLQRARAGFAALVDAFSRIEFVRFGPARQDFRFERLFFWPDRRGRGLKQVKGLIRSQDETALSAASLRAKSVAVQGLPALEYVLHGTGSEQLVSAQDGFRCGYALAIADNVLGLGSELVAGWNAPGGHRDLMASPGAENPLYRSDAEPLKTLIDAAREHVQIVREHKLLRPLGADIGTETPRPRPKSASFWRSGLESRAIAANLAGLTDLFRALKQAELAAHQSDHGVPIIDEVLLELRYAREAVAETDPSRSAPQSIFEDTTAREALVYATFPLSGVHEKLSDRLPAAFGLIVGFNSLDGD